MAARLLQFAARTLFGFLSRVFWRVRTFGFEHVPRKGPVLIAASHESFLDPLVIGSLLPRYLRFLARSTLFGRDGRIGLHGRVLVGLGATPINRDGGGARDTLRKARALLDAGEAVLIFPEGTRSKDGELQRFRRGVGIIARETGCPVLPVSIRGSSGLWPRGKRLPIVFGGPVQVHVGAVVKYEMTTSAEDIAADIRDRVLHHRQSIFILNRFWAYRPFNVVG